MWRVLQADYKEEDDLLIYNYANNFTGKVMICIAAWHLACL